MSRMAKRNTKREGAAEAGASPTATAGGSAISSSLPKQGRGGPGLGNGAGEETISVSTPGAVDPEARHTKTARPPGDSPQSPGASGALSALDARLHQDSRAVKAPRVHSFLDFLEQHARVPTADLRRAGEFDPFTFKGREALREPCSTLDKILGNETADPLKDSTLVLAGGAQFGKTILELMLAAYVTSQRWLNVGVYLPDDGLADGIVDAKFRPIVLDNLHWFAEMTQVGKAVNKSGKSVNTKGAFLVTDGERKAIGLFRGLKKIPTSFSMDVVIRDEEDDIPRDKAKFLSGRLTASALRLQIIVGTQRVHGAGQNRQWEQSSQGVMLIGPVTSFASADSSQLEKNAWITPEDHWPQVCRMQIGDEPSPSDPQLSWAGDFRRGSEVIAEYLPDGRYYLAHPDSGEALDRSRVLWHHRRPDRLKLRRFGYRISQIGCAAIDLAQIVAQQRRQGGYGSHRG